MVSAGDVFFVPAEGSPRREQVDSGNAAELASYFVEKGSRSACSPSEHVDIFWLVLRIDAELAELDDRRSTPDIFWLVLRIDAELAELDDRRSTPRIVSGENGSVNGIPFALRSDLPSRRTR